MCLLERLLDLFEVGQVTNVGCHSLGGSPQTGQSLRDHEVNLASVCLGRDSIGTGEASLLAEDLVETINLVTIAVEDLHELYGQGVSEGLIDAETMSS